MRAAWSYINHEENAAEHSAADARTINGRIKRAAIEHGVKIEAD